jgi:small-conductance mechanosensitive channel
MGFEFFSGAGMRIIETLELIPDPIVAVLVLAFAVTVALALYALVVFGIRRFVAPRHPFLHSLLVPLRGPLRLAAVLLALSLVLPIIPIDAQVSLVLARIFRLAVVALIGWMVLTATNIAADVYLRRFDIAVSDNLLARKQVTQVRVLKGALNTLIIVVTVASGLMTFDQVREYGVSLFASAGIAGIIVGLAARPMLSNLIAGLQLAFTQPIRLEDAVILENEMGFIEEITATYVVVRLWDWRRMVVPLTYFIEKPFQNWTRETSALIGSAFITTDFSTPVGAVRAKLEEIAKESPLWDGRVVNLQVWEADERGLKLRALVSAASAAAMSDLCSEVREKLVEFLQREHPGALPRHRNELIGGALPMSPAPPKKSPPTE